MKNELKVTGKQVFSGKEIPVVLGGFGADKKCMSDKTIAEIHFMREPEIRKAIVRNIARFKENIDFVDLKQRGNEMTTLELLQNLGYAKQSITQADHIYLLSERGYAKLIKIMDSDLAWEIHDKLMDEYFRLREEKIHMETLSPELQMFGKLYEALAKQELAQKQQEKKLLEIDNKVDSIKEIVALSPNSWRKDSATIINKIAQNIGGNEHNNVIRKESYELLDDRMGVLLKTRLTNKRRRMADEGVCKSKRDKLNCLDVIADDKKLIEGYVAIIKEMAVKYGLQDELRNASSM